MPGLNDGLRIKASYLTPYVALRTGVAGADTAPNSSAPSAANIIDMSNNQSAYSNELRLVGNTTIGSGTLSVQLWMLVASADEKSTLNALWVSVGAAVGSIAALSEISWSGLRAAKYFIQVTGVGASTWTLYTSNSVQNY